MGRTLYVRRGFYQHARFHTQIVTNLCFITKCGLINNAGCLLQNLDPRVYVYMCILTENKTYNLHTYPLVTVAGLR